MLLLLLLEKIIGAIVFLDEKIGNIRYNRGMSEKICHALHDVRFAAKRWGVLEKCVGNREKEVTANETGVQTVWKRI